MTWVTVTIDEAECCQRCFLFPGPFLRHGGVARRDFPGRIYWHPVSMQYGRGLALTGVGVSERDSVIGKGTKKGMRLSE